MVECSGRACWLLFTCMLNCKYVSDASAHGNRRSIVQKIGDSPVYIVCDLLDLFMSALTPVCLQKEWLFMDTVCNTVFHWMSLWLSSVFQNSCDYCLNANNKNLDFLLRIWSCLRSFLMNESHNCTLTALISLSLSLSMKEGRLGGGGSSFT